MENRVSPEYNKIIKGLDSVIRECIDVSQNFAGIASPTGAHYYASVLFTSLCTRGVTLAILSPHSLWNEKKIEHWDFSSIAGIVRSILEVRIAFFYLCSEEIAPVEWNCRWNIFNLHDCISRTHLFSEMPESQDHLVGFETQVNEIRDHLKGNTFFCNLPIKRQNELLKGKSAYLFPLEEIAVNAGVDLHHFRLLYKLLSSQVHGLPMSFYRNSENKRGSGVHSDSEEGFTTLCLSFAISLLANSCDEMRELFAGKKSLAKKDSHK